MSISTKRVEDGLKILGVEKEPAGLEMLSDESITPFGDIRAIFCDNELYGKVPIAKVRLAMKYLRGNKNSTKTDTISPEVMELRQKYGIRMKLEDVHPSELLEHYHPEQPNHPITIALRKKFGDRPMIVFKPDSKVVDIDATANYISDLELGFPEQDSVEVDGVLVRIYQVGKIPNQMIEEDPLFTGSPLKRGRSIINRLNWSEIQMPVRIFCRCIVDQNAITVENRLEVQDLYSIAQKGLPVLKKAFPEVDLYYREMAERGELPKLLISMDVANGKTQNPFGINRKF